MNRLVCPAALALLAAAGCSDLSDIDRRVDRVLAERSGAVGGGAIAPARSWSSRDLPAHRDLADRQPSTRNPAPENLTFKPAAEDRDFASRLSDLQEQTRGPDDESVLKFDLPGAWRQTQKSAREYLAAEEDYILAGIRLLIERHRWSINMFATTSANFASSQEAPSSNVVTLINELGARKQLPFGGEVAASWVWNAADNLRETATDRHTDSSELVLRGNIPLLRGSGLVAEESRIQAERDLVYAARDFENFRRQFLVDIARDYFSLLQQQDNIDSTIKQVESLRKIRDRQQELFESGRVARFEVNLAANDVLNAEAGLANTRESLLLSLDRFRVRLGLPEGARIRVIPSEFVVPEPETSLDEAVAMALDYRLDLQNRRDRLTDVQRGVRIAQTQLLPDLNATGSIAAPTSGGNDDFSEIRYGAGLTMNWPLDRENERLALRQSLIGLQQAERQFDQFRDELIIDVRARVREIERARFNLQLADDRVEINLRRKEEQDLKADELEPQALVDTANALRDAERARDQAKADLRNAVLQYLLATGTMRVKRDGTFEPLPGMDQPPAAPPAPAPVPDPANTPLP